MSSSDPSSSDDDLIVRARLRVGTMLRGKYRIDRILGVGGMAVVYAATHRNQAEFAIKMLHPELSMRGDVRTRFLREGYVANTVKHPGAVAVVDDDVGEDGAAFIVMEMLHGATVDDLAKRNAGRLPVAAALSIGYQLLDVLSAAHDKGIVHRDIKPANLFVEHDGTLKVLDFGIARLRDAASSMATGTGLMLGTPAFMAPEQALGKTNEIDGQTDLWAVGATIFWLLSARLVHDGDNASQLLIHAATVAPRPVSTVVPDVPRDVARIIDRALAFHKNDRWPNAAAMQATVRDVYLSMYGSVNDKGVLAQLVGPAVATTLSPDLVRGPQPLSTPGPRRPSTPSPAWTPAPRGASESGPGQSGSSSSPGPLHSPVAATVEHRSVPPPMNGAQPTPSGERYAAPAQTGPAGATARFGGAGEVETFQPVANTPMTRLPDVSLRTAQDSIARVSEFPSSRPPPRKLLPVALLGVAGVGLVVAAIVLRANPPSSAAAPTPTPIVTAALTPPVAPSPVAPIPSPVTNQAPTIAPPPAIEPLPTTTPSDTRATPPGQDSPQPVAKAGGGTVSSNGTNSAQAKQPPHPHPQHDNGPSPAPAPTAAAVKPGCSPNYLFDKDGVKHFKPECF